MARKKSEGKMRVNIQVSDEVKLFFEKRADSMGMATSQLMSMVLFTYMENINNQQAVRTLSAVSSSEETKENNAAFVKLLAEMLSKSEKE